MHDYSGEDCFLLLSRSGRGVLRVEENLMGGRAGEEGPEGNERRWGEG